jgi:O-methyltransferase involved in polyketide biosynthesis
MDGERADPDEGPRIRIDLSGVPETLLWTLYYRAQEAAHSRSVLPDPLAVQLVRRIDYPFRERLGRGARRAQWQGLRACTFDQRIRGFLRGHPGGTVVALGEGLETQFWRVDDGRLRWVGVDLAETGSLRRQVLPPDSRRQQVDGSVLDDDWMTRVEPGAPVLVTAQGLLMYLQREQVHRLLVRLARRFPQAELVFDGVPRWTSAVTVQSVGRPQRAMPAPPMPWWMDHREAAALHALPGVAAVRRLQPPRGRGPLHGVLLPLVGRLPGLRSQILSTWSVRFD